MTKFRKLIRTEMDVEIFSCVHGVSIIFLYGFLLWLTGEASVSFPVIFEIIVLGYLMSWTQKALFLKEKMYGKLEYQVREALWCLLPALYIPITAKLFHWFSGRSMRVEVAFYLIMACYFILLWVFLRCIYQEETEELNRLLKCRKEGDKK